MQRKDTKASAHGDFLTAWDSTDADGAAITGAEARARLGEDAEENMMEMFYGR